MGQGQGAGNRTCGAGPVPQEYHMAVQYHEQAYKLLEEVRDSQEQARCCKQIALAYDKIGEHDKEMEYHAKSVKVTLHPPPPSSHRGSE